MLKRLALLGGTATPAALAFTTTATASNSSNAIAGARCVKAGVAFLVDNNLLEAAALRQIDYSDLDSDMTNNDDVFTSSGPINTDLPNGSYLSLGNVIRLHFTNPEPVDWCA
jgi:hypothetical protein